MPLKSKSNLSTKIIVMVEVILLISSTLFCTVSIYRARSGIRRAIQQRMLDIANCASGSVRGDVLKSLTAADVGTPKYNEIYNTLAVFRDNVELEYVYCIRDEGNGKFIFTMDLDQYTPASYGDSVKYTKALATAGTGHAAVDEIPYSDAWGEFYSAYSPVMDSSGNVAGIIAVDFSADWFDAQLSAQTRETVVSYIVILLMSLLLAAVLSMLTVRPFVRMQGVLLEEKVRAESANRAKSDFLANMSHEIRTPINAVLGINELILREDLKARECLDYDPREAEEALRNIGIYAGDVKNAGNNLLAIINDILDFSRIESGSVDLREAPYQLSSLLNDLSNMIYFRAREKSLEFHIDVDESLPDNLCGDEVRVRQILINLLTNAVKYTDQGCVRLTVRGEWEDDGLLLHADVRDTGIGIRDEDMEELFTRFHRLDIEHNSTVEGTGLGLAITQRLVGIMGGTITVKSIYGEGSVFSVTIPQKVVSDEPMGDLSRRFTEHAEEARPSRPSREYFHAPSARILIVDDTQMNLKVAVRLLKATQMQIDTAPGGAESVEMAKAVRYDLILMDQRMPVMNGTEALHRIRMDPEGASFDVPVICLTADAVIGARERYLAEGFTDYITKPIDSRMLAKMIVKYLPHEKVEAVPDRDEPPRGGTSPGSGDSWDRNGQAGDAQVRDGQFRNGQYRDGRAIDGQTGDGQPRNVQAGDGQPRNMQTGDGQDRVGQDRNSEDRNELDRDGQEPGEYAVLRAAGIDPAVGLGYCQEDEGLYRSLLEEYAGSADEKAQSLRKYYDEGDWDHYAILVHSVKSSSRMIGAAALSDMAAGQEKAADSREFVTLKRNHPRILELYVEVTAAIRSAIGYSEDSDDRSGGDDDEIMEFLPE